MQAEIFIKRQSIPKQINLVTTICLLLSGLDIMTRSVPRSLLSLNMITLRIAVNNATPINKKDWQIVKLGLAHICKKFNFAPNGKTIKKKKTKNK